MASTSRFEAIDERSPTRVAGDDAADADELAAANDRALRLQAEMQNLAQPHVARDCRRAALRCAAGAARFVAGARQHRSGDRSGGEGGRGENLLAGFRLVRQQFETMLTRHQCEPIIAEGEPFDPHFHQAILQQPSADVPADHVDDGHAAGLQAARPRGAAGAGDRFERAAEVGSVLECTSEP